MRRLSTPAFAAATEVRAWLPSSEVASPGSTVASPAPAEPYRQAYLEGFDAGYADGDKEARRALEEAREAARAAHDSARAEEDRWRDGLTALTRRFERTHQEQEAQVEAVAVTVAFAAVCRLVGRLHADRDLITALCREALGNLRRKTLQLRIAPADLSSLESVSLPLPVTPDPALQPGDCIVETPWGDVDTGAEVQLRALLAALLETLQNKGERA